MEIDSDQQTTKKNTKGNASWKNRKTDNAGHPKQYPIGPSDKMNDALLNIQYGFPVL